MADAQPPQLPDGIRPEQRKLKTDPSLPTFDEDQVELLTFLIAHPDSPVNVVYEEVGVGAAKISQIRQELKTVGLLADLEVRTGRIGAGRPTEFMIPTVQAFELLGKEPPSGRGGIIHRHIQHAVAAGALAKLFSLAQH